MSGIVTRLGARLRRAPVTAQRGAALLMALLLLAVMLVVGGTALDTAMVEQRVAANLRDRAAAFEGAEAAALQSIARIDRLTMTGRGQPDQSPGYYYAGRLSVGGSITEVDNAPTQFWNAWSMNESNSIAGSLGSGASGLQSGRYLIERLQIDDEGEPTSASTYPLVYSRVTILAPGAIGANVMLQSILVGLP
jgi:Tfp pilus assembly protein PilX